VAIASKGDSAKKVFDQPSNRICTGPSVLNFWQVKKEKQEQKRKNTNARSLSRSTVNCAGLFVDSYWSNGVYIQKQEK